MTLLVSRQYWNSHTIMNSPAQPKSGRVASLHLHPAEPGAALVPAASVEAVEAKGLVGDARYFGRMSRTTGPPTVRQVTLLERELLAEHAAGLGLQTIAPGAARSNIETEGIDLVALVGKNIS